MTVLRLTRFVRLTAVVVVSQTKKRGSVVHSTKTSTARAARAVGTARKREDACATNLFFTHGNLVPTSGETTRVIKCMVSCLNDHRISINSIIIDLY